MAQVDVSVNGQSYRIACEDGQEDRLVDLAAMVDEKVIGLVNQIGQVGSNRLLVMAALIIADELVDLKNEAGSSQELEDNTNQQDTVLALQEITKRIENIADQVEQA
ncbi:MAG: cell division protein ZapA [Pseudomonadota bacterium]|nr:cell division protein ZapA [Pseudomonadota bacterium]MEC8235769.1 cell division protein ZapA [Pseudomonadota bacterium]MED5299815.1 cell division protein ZapA [Pseudomonadota bacterium]MEE3007639.1 cell division protein ZapA [Pseudomonadota bacterium]